MSEQDQRDILKLLCYAWLECGYAVGRLEADLKSRGIDSDPALIEWPEQLIRSIDSE